jgi:pimeloyl-ACP methyl ester carboxylesterase
MHYIYLHGFASSPRSHKGREIRDRFSCLGIPLTTPDLNQGDFTHLTLTRQIQQIEAEFGSDSTPVTLIGSSLGGLTAAWVGQRYSQVQQLVLLAPAFGFLSHWLSQLGDAQIQQWRSTGYLSVYHHSEEKMLPLHYGFLEDAALYQEHRIQRPVPTLILHGIQDQVIPIAASRTFAKTRPWVQLIELDSDHGLKTAIDPIWQEIQRVCQLPLRSP